MMRSKKPNRAPGVAAFIGSLQAAALLASIAGCPLAAQEERPELPARPNVLFIAVDDLNHWVRHLGRNPQAITPNLDRLAARGVTFTRAYCAAPVCNPSRAALMSGLRPSSSGVYDNSTDWRQAIPEPLMLTSHFRRHGYYVAGAGKIYHGGMERPSEWDEYMTGGGGWPAPKGEDTGVGGIRFAPLDCEDEETADYKVASWIIERLEREHEKPFFLACGIFRPHMPWFVPRKYYDMFPLDQIETPPVLASDLDDLPPAGVRMAGASGDHAAILRSGRWKEAVQGYLASMTYADAMIGRVLDALERSPHRDRTIVVLWGDHGWHLGEKHHWRKFALWEEATRVPLIWSAPGVTRPGGVCGRTVDLMSLYPTLSELCGLPVPEHVEGKSIRPLLADPAASWSHPALTTHGLGNHGVRAEDWRYIRYRDGGEELYDEIQDALEWRNLAGEPERAAVKAELAKHLPETEKPPPPPRQKKKQKAGGKKSRERVEEARAQPPEGLPEGIRPNIIFILADDLGYGDLGCYGQKRIRTPSIDRLAAEGVRFTQCYAGSTVCAPSRSALMQGLHTGHCRVRGNSLTKSNLHAEDRTVAAVLRDAGYTTAMIGKWGLGDPGTAGEPRRQGFDYFYGYLNHRHAHNYYPTHLWRNEEKAPLRNTVPDEDRFGAGVSDSKVEYSHDLIADAALEFIRRTRDKPFFLYFAPTIPHANNEAGKEGMEIPDLGAYGGLDWPPPQKGHAAMIGRLDRDVGRLLDLLEELDLDQRTIIFFSSDNGPHAEGGCDPEFNASSGPLRGFKRSLHDGGIRVPMIARWPGRIRPGAASDHVWAFWDFLPTAAALAGAEAPEGIDGISVLPALLGEGEQRRHEFLYWEFHERGFQQAGRMGDWKGVRPGAGRPLELYDLKTDIGEARNIAAEHPEVVQKLETLLDAARTDSPDWPAPRAAPGQR